MAHSDLREIDLSKAKVTYMKGWFGIVALIIIIAAGMGFYYLHNNWTQGKSASTNCPIYGSHTLGRRSYFYLPEGTIYGQASTENFPYVRPDKVYKIAVFNEEVDATVLEIYTCFNSPAEAEAAGYTFAGN